MYCLSCGHRIKNNFSKFCNECGDELSRQRISEKKTIKKTPAKKEVKKMKPSIHTTNALYVPQTGIVDYPEMTKRLIARAIADKGSFRTNSRVVNMETTSNKSFIRLSNGEVVFSEKIIFCAGLQSDRLAKLDGLSDGIQIVPFRGDYYQLKNESRFKLRKRIKEAHRR